MKHSNRHLPVTPRNRHLPAKTPKNYVKPAQNVHFSPAIPNIFNGNGMSDRYATRDSRVHCASIERTAIYRDANGNKIVLKENSTVMNTPEALRGVVYYDRGKKWGRK